VECVKHLRTHKRADGRENISRQLTSMSLAAKTLFCTCFFQLSLALITMDQLHKLVMVINESRKIKFNNVFLCHEARVDYPINGGFTMIDFDQLETIRNFGNVNLVLVILEEVVDDLEMIINKVNPNYSQTELWIVNDDEQSLGDWWLTTNLTLLSITNQIYILEINGSNVTFSEVEVT